jgi:hypothetical protein
MILKFSIDYAKYVDDTTVASVSPDPNDLSLQIAANHLSTWCRENYMKTNTKKTKEMIIHFGKKLTIDSIPPLTIDGDHIERVSCFKLLGVIISSDLSWEQHVSYILKKVSKRYYIIFQLSRIGIPHHDIILIYCSIIRSLLEYACPVWHSGLTTTLSDDIERVQKRCMRIIYPDLSYTDALSVSGLETLSERREKITRELFVSIQQPTHVLHSLLPLRPNHNIPIRDNYLYSLPSAKTNRYFNSFIPYCIRKRY